MRRLIVALVCFAVVATVPSTLCTEEINFKTYIDIYRIRGDISGETSLSDNIWSGLPEIKRGAKEGPFTVFTHADLTAANVKLKADEWSWTWNGQAMPPRGPRIEVVARPVIVSAAGKPFAVHTGSKAPIQYLKRRADGLFELKTRDVPLGIDIQASVEKGEAGRVVVRNLKISGDWVLKRRPIEGVSLNVGPPIVDRERYKTTLSVKLGCYYGIQLLTEKGGTLLIRLRVDVESPEAHGEIAVPGR